MLIGRTVTAVNRLLDIVSLFDNDVRIELVSTVDAGSAFSADVAPRLCAAGLRITDWDEVPRQRFHLALAASDRGTPRRVAAPLLLLQHGVGYHRFTPTSPGMPRAISGLTRRGLLAGNDPLPSAIAVAHPNQVSRLAEISPTLADRAVVTGDPCLDRMLASRRRRDRYRAALRTGDRELIVLSSTWGPHSLFGTCPDLPARLAVELPVDRYRIALILHPNITTRYRSWVVTSWLRAAVDAGVLVIPPDEGWRAAIVAASAVISDHGSVTCYAAAMGRPLLLTGDVEAEVAPDTPMASLLATLPRLDPGRSLRAQVEHLLSVTVGAAPTWPGQIFDRPGEAAERFRTTMYRLMDLAPPPWPAPCRALPVPQLDLVEPTALSVYATVVAHDAGSATVNVERFPAVAEWDDTDRPGIRHLWVDNDEADERLARNAAVITRHAPTLTTDTGSRWASDALADYPGCRIAAVCTASDQAVLVVRGGLIRRLRGRRLDVALAVSAVYTCLVTGLDLTALKTLIVHTGGAPTTVELGVVS